MMLIGSTEQIAATTFCGASSAAATANFCDTFNLPLISGQEQAQCRPLPEAGKSPRYRFYLSQM
jgi:hypothetical protein